MKPWRFRSTITTRMVVAGSLLLLAGCQHDTLPPAPPAPAAVASIALSFPGPTLSLGAVQPLQPQYRDADGNTLIGVTGATWSSSNAAIAAVDGSGNVTGVALGGPVTITVAKDGQSASATVSVIPHSINFSPYVSTLTVNQTLQLSAVPVDYSGTPIGGAPVPITWTSGTPSVAAIDATTGVVTALAPGIVRIFATAAGRTAALEIEVGVVSPYDGTWNGVAVEYVNGRNHPVQFTVMFGQVRQYQLTYGPSGPCSILTATPNAPIVDARFSFRFPGIGQGTTTVSGTFAGPGTLNGSHTPVSLGSCAAGVGDLNGGIITATKQ